LFPLRSSAYHFRKQAPIGPYIADFACHHARLVIEVDGESHFSEIGLSRDERRDAFLKGEGYTVLHFTNDDVLKNSEGVYAIILSTLENDAHAR
jgi:very-short-patch-repair endonuclease